MAASRNSAVGRIPDYLDRSHLGRGTRVGVGRSPGSRKPICSGSCPTLRSMGVVVEVDLGYFRRKSSVGIDTVVGHSRLVADDFGLDPGG